MVIDFQSVSFSYRKCNDFFTVKKGIPTDEELEKLSVDIGEAWKSLGRRLKIDEALLVLTERMMSTLKSRIKFCCTGGTSKVVLEPTKYMMLCVMNL